MKVGRALAVALTLVLCLVAVKERYDPFWVLFVDDLLHPKAPPLTVALNEDLALRLYADTRPHVGKVASLQKGLVLVYQGRELVEEGYGFGLPIVQVGDVAYLSRHATVSLLREGDLITLVKSYSIDVADRPTRILREKYQDVAPLGSVVFRYTLRDPHNIEVEVDCTGLPVDWTKAFLMNEQGAVSFPIYQDEHARTQHGSEVGIWRASEDSHGCWQHRSEGLRFCVKTEPGRRKFVGRERYYQYRWTGIFSLSWSGIDIQIDPPLERYQYLVELEMGP